MIEKWRWIKNYENKYMISNTGKVFSKNVNKFRKQSIDKDGYYFVILHGNGKPLKKFIHTLVLENFVSARPNGMIARHYPDQNKKNNNVENLSWCLPSTNSRDRQELGHLNTILTADLVIDIKNKLLSGNYTQAQLYKEYNVSPQTICDIVSEKSWKGVGENISEYNFDKRRILSELEISQIRCCIENGYDSRQIQKYFNLKYSHLNKIQKNLIRSDISACNISELPENLNPCESYDEARRKIKKEQYDDIKELIQNGKTLYEISKKYSVDPKTIYTIKKKLGL